MTKASERFFNDNRLPFAEARFSTGSTSPFKPHMHRTFSIGAVSRGEVLYRVGDQEALLAQGSLAVINPETLHSCNPCSEQGRSYFMLHLDVAWCIKVQQSMWQTDEFSESGSIRIDKHMLYDQYCRVINALFDQDTYLQDKEQQLYDLACAIFNEVCCPRNPTKPRNENTDRLRRLLQQDLKNDLTIDTLAHKLDANPYTLIRSFKSATGITPYAYRMNCRIDYAKQLLREGKDIADTAYLAGFFDQSHLHRHFKAITSVTPREYKVNFVQ